MKNEIKNGIIISIVVLLIIIVTYLLTAIFATGEIGGKKDNKTKTTEASGEVTQLYDNMIIASKTFNQKEEEYMVLFFSHKNIKEGLKTVLNLYDGQTKLYKVNIDEAINKFVLADEENNNATNLSDLKIKGTTLITINNKTIKSFISNEKEIIEKLK